MQHLATLVTQTPQSPPNCFLDTLGDRELGDSFVLPIVCGIQLLLRQQGLDHLFDEKRVPLGLAINRLGNLRRTVFPLQQINQQLIRLSAAQPIEGNPRRQSLAVPLGECVDQWVV